MQRPTAVTVFGILNIVFAAFGIFGVLASVMLFVAVGDKSHNPLVKIIHDSPFFAAWMELSIVLGLAAAAVLLAAGIGLLQLKPWARVLSIAYAIYSIIMVLIGTAVNFVFVTRPILEQSREASGPEAAGAIGAAVGGVVGSCVGLVYPILLLIFMLRPSVVAAFRPSGAAEIQLPPASQA